MDAEDAVGTKKTFITARGRVGWACADTRYIPVSEKYRVIASGESRIRISGMGLY